MEKSTQRRRAKRRLSEDEILAVIEGADNPRNRALIAFVANTAVRISEALSPTLKDIRLDLGEMYLMIHKIDEEVTFPITEYLDRELRRWLAVYREEAGGKLDGNWRLFPPRWPNRTAAPKPGEKAVPLQRGGFNVTGQIGDPADIIKRAAENAGVDLGPGDAWHTIRRSSARLVFDKATAHRTGDPMRMTQAFLNHKHMSTTEIYLDIEVERERLNQMLRGKNFLRDAGGNVVPIRRAEGE
jgi:integrase